MNAELFICQRYLSQKEGDSIIPFVNTLAIVGIAIGVTVLIIVCAAINGFKMELEYKILNVYPHINISRQDYCGNIKDDIAEIKGIISIDIVSHCQGLLRGVSGISGSLIKSVNFSNYAPLHATITDIYNTEISNVNKRNREKAVPIILGIDLAKQLGAERDGIVYLISPNGSNSFPSLVPFLVVAFFKTGIWQYDSTLAYIDSKNKEVLSTSNRLTTSIEVRLDNPYNSLKTAKIIKNEIDPTFLVRDWTQTNSGLFSTLKAQKVMMFIVLFFIVLVAAMSVSNALIMTVLSKTNDIVVLKSMGISNYSIGKIFVIRGIIIGILGNIIGAIMGLFFCYLLGHYEFINLPEDIYILSNIPINVNWQETIIVLFSTIVICFISSIFPAYKAALLKPNRIVLLD